MASVATETERTPLLTQLSNSVFPSTSPRCLIVLKNSTLTGHVLPMRTQKSLCRSIPSMNKTTVVLTRPAPVVALMSQAPARVMI